jgi:hypothetical protein
LNGADEGLQLSLIEPVAGSLLLHMHTDSAYAPPPRMLLNSCAQV